VFQNLRRGKKNPVVMPYAGTSPLGIKRCEEGHDLVLWRCTGPDTEPCWFCGGRGNPSGYWLPSYAAGWYYLVAARQARGLPYLSG
jgi:hypothetical protein